MEQVSETSRHSSTKAGTAAGSKRKTFRPLVFSVAALLGVFGGISILFAGLVCVIVHYAVSGDNVFSSVGTVFLIAAIPMMLVGSIFLDKAGHPSK